ncbi:hypothetical protein JTE90_002367 [Oedothorax gibbosus]|uniref:SCP domain-containing protein n=1 Tax=Oedothorax gibbosus TaxID=931172 RepID=A0AAV6VBM1_9ARAC|nr:hypothetical protein JTE90_002367 [Oedothorax gibbosus]
MSHCGRKRPRSCDEECCELMPISKRINDLHIRSGCPDSNNMQQQYPRMQTNHDMNLYELHKQAMEAKNNNMACNYKPELSAIQNPYYYHMNEVLYTAHIQQYSRMDCFLQKLRDLRSTKVESPKYRRQRTTLPTRDRTGDDSASDSGTYYSASSDFVDKVILGRHIYIRGGTGIEDEEKPDYTQSEFVSDCLYWHNVFREKHDVPPLSLNTQLCSQAQFWANHLAHTNSFSHRNLRNIGENLFSKWSYIPEFDITAQQVAKYWYEEIKAYNFFAEPSLLHVKAGKFTQMVWRSSTDFGIGKAKSRCGKVIVVGNYKPAGNIIGEFHENVFPPINDMDILNEI